ncbi:sugar ABC transporter permease [Streptomyces sp. TRM66268-LWL]|uniref:Sugar ABC transporter permease n=1 Tax=Streptomyces polyasparticus TaxID=2767826 RepID=A0ABR7SDX3_9ACTN|nr:sugar ABC transporter permease [Streptomyces polyasparticus]MBC9712930.1 sugar ABC transporter permease [Streptomyces polyasparticus]
MSDTSTRNGAPVAKTGPATAPSQPAAPVKGPRPAGPPGRRRIRTHLPSTPWLFLLPGFSIIGGFVLFPFFSTVSSSFTDQRTLIAGKWVGGANYQELWHDDMFWIALRNSLLYIVGVVPPLVILPLLLAMLVQRYVPGISFFRSAFYTPVVASVVVVGLIWVWMLDDRGLVNAVLGAIGVGPVAFLSDQWLLLISAMLVTVWKGLGYYMIIYMAALGNVPKELHEAAAVDGAGAIRRFFTVTVPAVRSTMVLVAALSSVNAFKVFSEVYLMAGPNGGPGGEDTTLVMLIKQVGTGLSGRVGYASAISVVVFVITLGLMLLVLKADKKEGDA